MKKDFVRVLLTFCHCGICAVRWSVDAQWFGNQRPGCESPGATASPMAMSPEQSVLPNVGYTSAQGERPASDFPQQDTVPLGTAARPELKKEHAQLKKSRFVWVNQ